MVDVICQGNDIFTIINNNMFFDFTRQYREKIYITKNTENYF